MFDCCLLGGGERVLNDFSQRLPLTRHGKQSIVELKIYAKKVKPPFSNSETELIPRFCSAKEVNHRLPLTWDGTGLLWALTGTSVQFDGSLSVLLKNTTHNIKYWQGDLNQWSLRLWPNDHYCWYISACCI